MALQTLGQCCTTHLDFAIPIFWYDIVWIWITEYGALWNWKTSLFKNQTPNIIPTVSKHHTSPCLGTRYKGWSRISMTTSSQSTQPSLSTVHPLRTWLYSSKLQRWWWKCLVKSLWETNVLPLNSALALALKTALPLASQAPDSSKNTLDPFDTAWQLKFLTSWVFLSMMGKKNLSMWARLMSKPLRLPLDDLLRRLDSYSSEHVMATTCESGLPTLPHDEAAAGFFFAVGVETRRTIGQFLNWLNSGIQSKSVPKCKHTRFVLIWLQHHKMNVSQVICIFGMFFKINYPKMQSFTVNDLVSSFQLLPMLWQLIVFVWLSAEGFGA